MLAFRCVACGEYFIDPLAAADIRGSSPSDRFLIAASVRQASDSGQRLEIVQDDIRRLRDGAPRWRALSDGIDRLLLLLARRATSFRSAVPIDNESDFPLVCALGPGELYELQVFAEQAGLIDMVRMTISLKGWERIDSLRQAQPDSRRVFVAMWFDLNLDDAWVNGFKVGIEEAGYFTATRIDLVPHNEKIDDRIIAEIRRSRLVVADFTGQRGGVYFEAGYALGLGIDVIWTCRTDFKDSLHFDTRQYNHIIWDTPADLRRRLSDRLAATHLSKGWGAG